MKYSIGTISALAAMLLSSTVIAETITVGPGGNIQDAINRASSGDTISVAPGQYRPFEVTKNGITVRSSQPGGARIVATTGRAISAYGQSNITIDGFRVSAPRSDGVAITGAPGRLVSGVRIANVTVENAGRDGIKVAQLQNSYLVGNRVERGGTLGTAGSSGNRNGDGGIDCVTCEGVTFQENRVSTQGWAALMLKGNSRGNRIVNNTFANSDARGAAVAVGGLTSGRASAAAGVAGNNGSEASGNLLEGNTLNSAGCGFAFIDAQNNRLTGNRITQGRNCPTSEGTNNGSANVTAIGPGPTNTSGGGGSGGSDFDGAIDDADIRTRVLGEADRVVNAGCQASNTVGDASAAIGAISSLFGGGRATAPLQIAQQIQLVAQRICQQQSLLYQIKSLAGMDIRTTDDVLWAMDSLGSILAETGMDQPIAEMLGEFGIAYPRQFGSGTFETVEQQEIIWDERTRTALDRKGQIENTIIRQQQESMRRASQIEQGGRDSGGIRGAALATNALLNELMGSLNNQITATVAHQRALSEVQYREEAKKEAAKTMSEEFMSTLSQCENCEINKPFFGN